MIIGLQVVGLHGLIRTLETAARAASTPLYREMERLVQEVAGEARRNIHGSRATNPPEVLGVRTGRLRQSITGRVRGSPTGREIQGIVGPQRVVYAAIHEFGGTAGVGGRSRIPARPYLGPALEAKREAIARRLGAAYVAGVFAASGA